MLENWLETESPDTEVEVYSGKQRYTIIYSVLNETLPFGSNPKGFCWGFRRIL
jgi:hypothetical protein